MSQLHKKHFYLNRDCILVPSAKNSAVYNLSTGDIFKVEQQKAKILYLADKGLSIDSIDEEIQSANKKDISVTLDEAYSNNIGEYYDKKIFKEKYRHGRPGQRESFKEPPIIGTCYVELPGECDNDCDFCTSPEFAGCNMCTPPSTNSVKLSELQKAFQRISKMQLNSIIFHGGDPLIEGGMLFSLLKYCRSEGYSGKLWVISNASELTDRKIKQLNEYNTGLIIPFDDDAIISKEELHKEILRLNEREMSFQVTLVLHNANVDKSKTLQNTLKSFGVNKFSKTTWIQLVSATLI